MTYNYSTFKTRFYDLSSFEGPRRGEQMPDLTLSDLDGNPVALSSLWDGRVVIETGSITCPMYAKGVDRMARLAEQHPDTRFVVLYVREAHPGERVARHTTAADKLSLAAGLHDTHGESRTVLVDDVEGTAHKALGLLPDMVYVIDPGGKVVFRGDWNNPAVVEEVLNDTASGDLLAREHFPPTKPTPRVATRTLMKGGFKAVVDFLVGLPGLIALHRKADSAYAHDTSDES